MPGRPQGEARRTRMLLGVSTAAFLGPFTQTVYVPSLVEIGGYLHANAVLVNLTISIFTVILALSSFIVGPLADAFGRRAVLIPGLLIFVVGSLVCLFASSYAAFLAGRVVQACGISTGSVVAAAVIGDLYAPQERAHAMNTYQLLVFLGPVFGPIVGGLVAGYLHWQWAFAVLAAAGLAVAWYNVAMLPELLAGGNGSKRLSIAGIRSVVGNVSARSILLISFSQYYGYYVFLVFLPRLAGQFGLSTAEKGFAFIPLTAGILAGISGARRWLAHWPGTRILRLASYALAGDVLLLWLLVAGHALTQPLLGGVLLIYGLLLGGSLPAQSTILVNLFTAERATAMGIYNFARFMGAAAGPLLGAYIADVFGSPAMWAVLGALLLASAWVIQHGLVDPFERSALQRRPGL